MTRASQSNSERLYRRVKRELLAGAFRPGERIDAAGLAERHFASVTPVRAALLRLVGEQLVEARPSEGFHAPRVTEPGLRDLYAWNEQIVLLAWRLVLDRGGDGAAAQPLKGVGDEPLAILESLFAGVGDLSGNDQCAAALRGLNDRLHLARRMERELFADIADELAALSETWASSRHADIRRAVSGYHRRRLRALADIVRVLHRPPGAAP